MTLDAIRSDFALLDDWEDRYRYVIELGRGLPPLPEALRTEANKVRGCASQVWLASTARPPRPARAPVLAFQGDSDAHIVRGLIAILFAMYQDKTAEEILRADAQRAVRRAGAQGAPDAAALERLLLHGRAHPQRRARAGCRLSRRPATLTSAARRHGRH